MLGHATGKGESEGLDDTSLNWGELGGGGGKRKKEGRIQDITTKAHQPTPPHSLKVLLVRISGRRGGGIDFFSQLFFFFMPRQGRRLFFFRARGGGE